MLSEYIFSYDNIIIFYYYLVYKHVNNNKYVYIHTYIIQYVKIIYFTNILIKWLFEQVVYSYDVWTFMVENWGFNWIFKFDFNKLLIVIIMENIYQVFNLTATVSIKNEKQTKLLHCVLFLLNYWN